MLKFLRRLLGGDLGAATSAGSVRPVPAADPPTPQQPPTSLASAEPAGSAAVQPAEPPAGPPVALPPFREPITSWACHLHDVDPAVIGRLDVDLVVVDFDQERSRRQATFVAADVRRMQARPGARKRVAAYMCIGEAETFRSYWRPNWLRFGVRPEWLAGENEEWEDSYRVRYWLPAWHRMLYGQPGAVLDEIMAAGFDGVYLDLVDAYESHLPERPSARDEMVALVVALAAYARARRPEFLVIAQNGEALLEVPAYRAALSAVAKEDLLYGIHADGDANAASATDRSAVLLDMARRDGVGVLVIEYLDDPKTKRAARGELLRRGYVGFMAPSESAADVPAKRPKVPPTA